MMRNASVAIVVALLLPAAALATPITNPSFESTTPAVGSGACGVFSSGSTGITGWTVVGNTGTNVAVCNTNFVQAGIAFHSQDGSNWLDLTGDSSNSTTEGVQQSIATTVGDSFTLSFFVGNVDSPSTGFGVTSTVDVFANGSSLGAFTNSCTTCTTTLGWQPFSVTFTATSALTTFLFRNGDPVTDNSNGLDNLVLTDNGPAVTPPGAVPEPTSLLLLGTGLLAVGARGWRNRRQRG
jgi:hypothetical protein